MSDTSSPTWKMMIDAHFRLQNRLPMWVIYSKNTSDYPGVFAARMHLSLPQPEPTVYVMTHDTLEGLRSILPPGMACIGREPGDDANIIEVWL
jgi:hypothetical protein